MPAIVTASLSGYNREVEILQGPKMFATQQVGRLSTLLVAKLVDMLDKNTTSPSFHGISL